MLIDDINRRLGYSPIAPPPPPQLLQPSDPGRMQVARHEAAHAVVAASLGLDVERIRLEPRSRGGWQGWCEHRAIDPWHKCLIAAAGPIADEWFYRRMVDLQDTLSLDVRHLVALAPLVDSDDPERVIDCAINEAYWMVRRNEFAVLELARHLHDSPEDQLSARQIDYRLARFFPYFGPAPEAPIPERIKRFLERRAVSSNGEQLLYRTDGYLRAPVPAQAQRAIPEERIVRGPGGIIGRLVRTADGLFRALDNDGRCYGIFDNITSGCKALPG
jgi:hypothetical protein